MALYSHLDKKSSPISLYEVIGVKSHQNTIQTSHFFSLCSNWWCIIMTDLGCGHCCQVSSSLHHHPQTTYIVYILSFFLPISAAPCLLFCKYSSRIKYSRRCHFWRRLNLAFICSLWRGLGFVLVSKRETFFAHKSWHPLTSLCIFMQSFVK